VSHNPGGESKLLGLPEGGPQLGPDVASGQIRHHRLRTSRRKTRQRPTVGDRYWAYAPADSCNHCRLW